MQLLHDCALSQDNLVVLRPCCVPVTVTMYWRGHAQKCLSGEAAVFMKCETACIA